MAFMSSGERLVVLGFGLFLLFNGAIGVIEIANGVGYLTGHGDSITVRVEGTREVQTEEGTGRESYGYYDKGGERHEVVLWGLYEAGATVEAREVLVPWGITSGPTIRSSRRKPMHRSE
ncbi:hypothetical protein [Nocardia crassostreae]|uniref:hypothetical protein n=1 Tax=Nocardia crassostreae TaxID=53428 RepID=UPI000AB44474|nr:hypothetical protein [Nocardia crassostreae]